MKVVGSETYTSPHYTTSLLRHNHIKEAESMFISNMLCIVALMCVVVVLGTRAPFATVRNIEQCLLVSMVAHGALHQAVFKAFPVHCDIPLHHDVCRALGTSEHRRTSCQRKLSSHSPTRRKATLRKHKSSLKDPKSRQIRNHTSEGFSSGPELTPSGDASVQETPHLSTQAATTSSNFAPKYIQPVTMDLQTRELLTRGPQGTAGATMGSSNELQVSWYKLSKVGGA